MKPDRRPLQHSRPPLPDPAAAGAYVGQYAIIASPLVGPAGSVHAFEPDPDAFRQLVANVRLNRCDNVACNQMALAREAGTALRYLADVSNIGGNSLFVLEGGAALLARRRPLMVLEFSIDTRAFGYTEAVCALAVRGIIRT